MPVRVAERVTSWVRLAVSVAVCVGVAVRVRPLETLWDGDCEGVGEPLDDPICVRDGDKDALPDGLGVVESEPLRVREPLEEAVKVAEAVPELEAVGDDVAA